MYFFPCGDDGLSADCRTVPLTEVRPLERADRLPSLPLAFLAIHGGLQGRAFLTQGGLYAEPFVGEDVCLPTKTGAQAYFVPGSATRSSDKFSEDSVKVVSLDELLVPGEGEAPSEDPRHPEETKSAQPMAVSAEKPVPILPRPPSGSERPTTRGVPTVTPQDAPREAPPAEDEARARASRSSRRLPQGRDGEWTSQEDRALFLLHWPHLRRQVGWKVEWSAFGTDELYVVPGGSSRDGRLEGVQFFTHRDSFVQHLVLNPCLRFTWPELKAALRSHHWEFSPKGGPFRCAFPVGDRTAVEGVHVFRTRHAVTTFVNRYPYPLQDDDNLSALLLSVGWKAAVSKKKGKVWAAPEGGEPQSLNAVRRQMWLEPALLLKYLCAKVEGMDELLENELTDTIRVDDPRTHEFEAASDDELEEDAGSQGKLQQLLKFVGNSSLESFDEKEFRRLLGGLSWVWESAAFSKEWWKYEFVFVAPWANTAKPKSMKPGLDFFFNVRDVYAYIRDRGHSDSLRHPIELEMDLRQPEYNINKRIHEIAQSSQPLTYNLLNMLYATGWELRELKRPLLSHASVKEIYLPYWSLDKFDEDLLGSLTAGEDFFVYKEDAVEYLRTHGNLQGDCVIVDSPRALKRSKREMNALPDTPRSRLEYLIAHSEDIYRADIQVWGILRDFHEWRCVATQGRKHRENCLYLPPWGRERFEAGGKSEPDMMVLHRDYFYDTLSLLKYLVKYGNQETNAPVTPEENSWRGRRCRQETIDRTADDNSSVMSSKTQKSLPANNKKKAPSDSKSTYSVVGKRKLSKREVSSAKVDKQVRHLVLALLELRRVDPECDLRLLKFVYGTASKDFGLRWFHSSRCGLTIKIYTFMDKRLLNGPKQLHSFIEGKDYWIDEDNFMEYILSQLRILGYDDSDNTIDPSVTVITGDDDDHEKENYADAGYSLDPLGNVQPLSSGSEDLIARFAPNEGMVSAFSSPHVGSFTSHLPCKETGKITRALSSPISEEMSLHRQKSAKKTRSSSSLLSQRIADCKYALLPSAREQTLIGREEQYSSILNHLKDSIAGAPKKGLFLCGMSGIGKTATAEEVISFLQSESQKSAEGEFIIARFTGTGLTLPFTYMAESLGLMDKSSGQNEYDAQLLCSRNFSPTMAQLSRKHYPRYVMLIDEIDKMPRAAVRELYVQCVAPSSRIAVLGIANDISFPRTLKLPEEADPAIIVFPPLDKKQLKEVLSSRAHGVFSEKAIEVLVMKTYQRGGDVRLLLDLAIGSLEYATSRTKYVDDTASTLVEYGDVLKHCNTVGLGTA